jgi:GT2 family glycosyltransferase
VSSKIKGGPTRLAREFAQTSLPAIASGGPVAQTSNDTRVVVDGKFICLANDKLYVRGVTYGAFAPDEKGDEYHDLALIDRDFAQMADCGINAVRIPHTMPPVALLDTAERHGLHVMVGLSAEQNAGYLTDAKGAPDVERMVREKVRAVAGHPAILCYALGNEIPASTVRWLGRRRVERYLERLWRAVKKEDPEGLVTYVNYPSTEYLQLPFLDIVSFNVYLETQDRFEAYLARLQNIAGERPVLMSEIGLDSLRNGEQAQAEVIDWQVRSTLAGGCAGAFVFSWTDEWNRAGRQVDDWAFGLTRRDRSAKPALASVASAFAEAPFPSGLSWPRISVIVCSCNGARWIRNCLAALAELDYPDFEVIVIDDGSTDPTSAIAGEYDVTLIRTPNLGLSSARNTGLRAATGEIVAYTDDDAFPGRHWLKYLAWTFLTSDHVGAGGPNLAPREDGLVANAVSKAPGGPIHVLLSDEEAEHIPGCNMAFRKQAVEEIGGFDEQFRIAGDDVDLCWRLREAGGTIGFSPAAVVWHHRRTSVRAYWRQQKNYGRAEALLERKWPERYNGLGHVRWAGRVYGNGGGLAWSLKARGGRIYQGVWGTAPFQSLYQPAAGLAASLPLMPEWYLLIGMLAGLSALGTIWTPMFLAAPLVGLAVVVSVLQAVRSIASASFGARTGRSVLVLRTLGVALYLIQPLARLSGRLGYGLTPWRRRGKRVVPRRRRLRIATDQCIAHVQRLHSVETGVREGGAIALHGDEYDGWDIEIRGGIFGAARLLIDVEDHPADTQLVRVSLWPRWSVGWLALSGICGAVLVAAALAGAWIACTILALITAILVLGGLSETAQACAHALRALEGQTGLTATPETRFEPEQDTSAWSSETGQAKLRGAELLQRDSQA